MNYIKSLIVICLFVFVSCDKQQNKKQTKIDPTISKIEVIDFHSTKRCFTCNAIEENTKFTLQTYFADELKNGKITFQVVNVDEEKNYTLAEKFQATGTSLFINVISKGKEHREDLTKFAFSKARNKDVFSLEFKNKIENALKSL